MPGDGNSENKPALGDSPRKPYFETPQKAQEELGSYYKGLSGKLTEASIQMCYGLIGANWVVFGSVGGILHHIFAKASLLMVMLALALNVVNVWILSESTRRRFDWVEGHYDQWQVLYEASIGKRDPFPFTDFHERMGFWTRQLKAILPLMGAAFLIYGAIIK